MSKSGRSFSLFSAVVASTLLSTTAFADADTAQACLNCHEADELKGASAEAVLEVLKKPAPRVHKRYAKLTVEEVQAVLDALE